MAHTGYAPGTHAVRTQYARSAHGGTYGDPEECDGILWNSMEPFGLLGNPIEPLVIL